VGADVVERGISNAGGHPAGERVTISCCKAFSLGSVDEGGAIVRPGHVPADNLPDEQVLALLHTDEVGKEGVVSGLIVHDFSSSDETATVTLSGPIGIDRSQLTSPRMPVQLSEIARLDAFMAWLSETPEQAA
jgi:hypothetical protein